MNSIWVNLLALIVSNSVFLFYLIKKYQFKVSIFNNTTINGILLAISCSILFFFLLDKFLDPFFDSIFIISAGRYQETILELQQAPIANFIRICLLAPIVEEILMRGFILNSLQNKYGMVIALLVSSLLFAILHFNFVQTLSAVICGLILGLLYINTGSLFCCILAHSLYNGISFFTSVLNFRL
ncbi:CPBP family intramembrane glutamic endopeptidase [Lutispora saccharofermentans]|uniref:CPBP family intramembrane metalloprotease n=1 Tax=Lutispora saccharofermentans TaxID=3024236 RepID=A0ABT1NIT9_9FIRM|nr:CPBP family intramembrane glutamic endopeptidase [Lutispora saccharofermentans]MCQ1530211.1 CPBP family intramembrane metalloprotease [Lutispora saccharofermentans]